MQQWEHFVNAVGVKSLLYFARALDLVTRAEATRLQLFKGTFAGYRCDAHYRLMALIVGRFERSLRVVR